MNKNKFLLIIVVILIVISGAVIIYLYCLNGRTETINRHIDNVNQQTESFCGSSSYGTCENDEQCLKSGCSGQDCKSVKEPPEITTCEWKDCYDEKKYELECSCVNNHCQWYK